MACLVELQLLSYDWIIAVGESFSETSTPLLKSSLPQMQTHLISQWLLGRVTQGKPQMDAGFCSWTVTSSAVNTSPLTVGHTATHPSLVPWLPPFNWLCTKQCWLPERGPCPAIITPSMGWHADRQGGGGTPGVFICSMLRLFFSVLYYYYISCSSSFKKNYFQLENLHGYLV